MPIFSERSFRELMDKVLVVHPAKQESMTGVGYDLNIGFFIQIDRRQKKVVANREVKDGDRGVIDLKPDHYLVAITREFVYLSSRVAATFHSKSTLAAQAIFLNSTTGDPNWDGRLIFLLYNAAGTTVGIRLDESFVTMVVNNVERRSFLTPKDPKQVLDKYIEGFGADFASAIHYVMKEDPEHQKRVDKTRKFSGRSTPVFMTSILFHRYGVLRPRVYVIAAIVSVFGFSLYVWLVAPAWLQVLGFEERSLSIAGSLFSILSGVTLLVTWIKGIIGRSKK